MELTVPPEDAHWSLKFVDIWKPFPQQIVANATYKVIRFFYPPFAVEAVDVTHVVSDPELNGLNVALLLGFPLFLASIGYGVYKYVLKVVSLGRCIYLRLLTSVYHPTGSRRSKGAGETGRTGGAHEGQVRPGVQAGNLEAKGHS